jgi:hypothetical protein
MIVGLISEDGTMDKMISPTSWSRPCVIRSADPGVGSIRIFGSQYACASGLIPIN